MIRIESLTVNNLRVFRGEQRLSFNQNCGTLFPVVGKGATGKTTLAESFRLCLTGGENSQYRLNPLVTQSGATGLSPGERSSGSVSYVVSANDCNQRHRFSRQFQTTNTREGNIDSVGPLQVEKWEDEEETWISTSSPDIPNSIFPPSILPFVHIEAEPQHGLFARSSGTGWREFIDKLESAICQQSAAQGRELPNFLDSKDDLRAELLRRVSNRIGQFDRIGNHPIELTLEEEGLMIKEELKDETWVEVSLASGDLTVISHVVSIVAGELLPETPPVIADSILGRLDQTYRAQLLDFLKDQDRQIILFSSPLELQGLDISPQYYLDLDRDNNISTVKPP